MANRAPAQRDLLTKRWRAVKPPSPSEDDIHFSIVEYLRRMIRPDVEWWHVPNGEKRERVPVRKSDGSIKWWCPSGKKAKKFGAKPGAPDLMFRWRARWSTDCLTECVDVEVKSEDGVQSDDQIAWEKGAKANGIPYYIVRSLDEAIAVFEKHRITRPRQAAGRRE